MGKFRLNPPRDAATLARVFPGLQLDPWVSIQGFSLSRPGPNNEHYRLRYLRSSRLLHRTIMAVVIGMEVPRGYVVHHRDGDVHNNQLDNLALMTGEVHTSHHKTQHTIPRTCDICGRSFIPCRAHAERPREYCSRECARLGRFKRRGPRYGSNARPKQAV